MNTAETRVKRCRETDSFYSGVPRDSRSYVHGIHLHTTPLPSPAHRIFPLSKVTPVLFPLPPTPLARRIERRASKILGILDRPPPLLDRRGFRWLSFPSPGAPIKSLYRRFKKTVGLV